MPQTTLASARGVKEALNARDYPRAAALVTMLRLHWFTHLRWVFLGLAVITLMVERLAFRGYQRPLTGLIVVLAALGAVNVIWSVLSRQMSQRFQEHASVKLNIPVELFANGQVALDIFFLTCILHLTGGAENPMSMFYLFHMAIVSLLLETWQALLNGVWALLLYCGMVIGEWQELFLKHYAFLPQCPSQLHNEIEFVVVTIVVVACGVLGTLYFTLQIAGVIRKREYALQSANRALEQSQTAIRDLQVRRSRFMQTAAHQLKSPLAVIQTLTELIRSEIVPPEAIHGTCGKIINRCQEGIRQVAELLTLARVQESDPKRHGRSESDVRLILVQIIKRLKPLAKEKNIAFSWSIPEGKPLNVFVDPRDLEDCLGNLVENAIKYTPGPGSVNIKVTSQKTALGEGEIAVTISDTGIGINPELLVSEDGTPGHAPVFDDFRRGNNALTAGIPGTGLGLSIVREIVEQTGGKIRVNSHQDKGTTFIVSFPVPAGFSEGTTLLNTRACEVVLNQEAPESPPEKS